MTRIRVLFADDQLPYDQADQNASVKSAILKEIGDKLRAANKDPEAAFAADFAWFQGLRQHLDERFEVVPARTFADAQAALHRRDKYDVAVIDLSWSGDAQLTSGKRHNVGLELLEILKKQNDAGEGYKPVLAFSQNFEKDAQLMSLVLDCGALPVPKMYTDTGHQALSSAISYLAKVRPPGSKAEDPALAVARVNKTTAILVALITGVLGLVGGVIGALVSAQQ
jgi:hypothetical protein